MDTRWLYIQSTGVENRGSIRNDVWKQEAGSTNYRYCLCWIGQRQHRVIIKPDASHPHLKLSGLLLNKDKWLTFASPAVRTLQSRQRRGLFQSHRPRNVRFEGTSSPVSHTNGGSFSHPVFSLIGFLSYAPSLHLPFPLYQLRVTDVIPRYRAKPNTRPGKRRSTPARPRPTPRRSTSTLSRNSRASTATMRTRCLRRLGRTERSKTMLLLQCDAKSHTQPAFRADTLMG